jgi:hypothetical protein
VTAVGATQDDARKRGLLLYRASKPCQRGHDSPRYVSSRQCVKCAQSHSAGPKVQRRRRERKPAAAVVVNAPEPKETGPGAQRHRFKYGGWADTVEIHAGTAKLISDCIERVFNDAPRIGHERLQRAAA